MANLVLPRPQEGDAASYYFTYIDKVPDGDVLALLENNLASTRHLLSGLRADQELRCYAPGKWTIRDVVGHMVDAERVFGYRAFHMARGDGSALPSMDQETYARNAGADRRSLAEHLDELESLRRGHLALFRGFDAEAWERVGTASGFPFKVRVFPFILVGHEIHHLTILSERYLNRLN